MMRNHIIFFSGGKASFVVADFVKKEFPNDNIVLYFTDTLWENEDLYRFIAEASDKLQLPMLTHSAGINPMQLMFEKKMVYNSRIGDCSKLLKVRVASDFLKKGIIPPNQSWRNHEHLKQKDFVLNATLYFGIGFDEMHRQGAIVKNWLPFHVEMPLIENNIRFDEVLKKYDIKQPRLYDMGFSHNNCNGRCVKAGQGHFLNLKNKMPVVFDEIMQQEHNMKIYVSAYRYIQKIIFTKEEEEVRDSMLKELDEAYRDYFYGKSKKPKLYIHPSVGSDMKIKQYSFMKKRSEPYPIRQLMLDDEKSHKQMDLFDIGGCGCFLE